MIIKYVMEVVRPFRYWTIWISKWHTAALHHVITLYNDMFDHMDGVLWTLARNKTQWKEDLYFVTMVACQILSKYYAEGTPATGLLLISAPILYPPQDL